MARTLESKEIVEYNLISKTYIFALFFHTALLFAIWPSTTRIFASGNFHLVRSKLVQCFAWGLTINIFTTAFLLWKKEVVIRLLGGAGAVGLQISDFSIVLFFVYFCLRIWTDTYAMLFQSRSALKVFWVAVPIQALISLTTQLYLSRLWGINGIVMGLILSYLLTVTWMLPYEHYRYIRKVRPS
jgi:O-antigen/teichoic acid export membrane protein